MSLLLISIAALLAGPLMVGAVGPGPRARGVLDGYVLATIGGLVAVHLAPMALDAAGPWALVAMTLGVALPWLVERRLHAAREEQAHAGSVMFAVGGLALHALLDGAALATPDAHGHVHEALALAVIVHRLPMGLLVWWAMSDVAGRRAVIAMLALMAGATVVGYFASEPLLRQLPPLGVALFIAAVAGALLHVLGHALSGLRGAHRARGPLLLGALLGVLTVGALSLLES